MLSSKLQLKYGELKEADCEIARTSLSNLEKIWCSVGLSFTPKVHGILDHSIMQMCKIGRFGDMLEDDV